MAAGHKAEAAGFVLACGSLAGVFSAVVAGGVLIRAKLGETAQGETSELLSISNWMIYTIKFWEKKK
jgi:hypothetical protein